MLGLLIREQSMQLSTAHHLIGAIPIKVLIFIASSAKQQSNPLTLAHTHTHEVGIVPLVLWRSNYGT